LYFLLKEACPPRQIAEIYFFFSQRNQISIFREMLTPLNKFFAAYAALREKSLIRHGGQGRFTLI
jgi:hypothetical protein